MDEARSTRPFLFLAPDYIVGGRGPDDLLGGRGNDVIEAADGREEWLDCGSGNADRASVDQGIKLATARS